jgi:hypothetical protein
LNITEVTNESTNTSSRIFSNYGKISTSTASKEFDVENIELGTWLLGLRAYVRTQNHSFVDGNREKATKRNWLNDLRIIHSTLLSCSYTIAKLHSDNLRTLSSDREFEILDGQQNLPNDFTELHEIIQNLTILTEAILGAKQIEFFQWTAFCNIFSSALDHSETFEKVTSGLGERFGDKLPKLFQESLRNQTIPTSVRADVEIVLPYFARILGCLNFIEKQLEIDRPLKPTLVLFTVIYEHAQEMLSFLRNRLARFGDEQTPMSEILDCTIFATSIELRRVYQSELSEVSAIRQAPVLRTRIDAAYGLMRDCFQQNFLLFAQIIEPELSGYQLFPNIKAKLDQSLALRNDLWRVLKDVQNAEKDIENFPLSDLIEKLNEFAAGSMKFLMYKDTETVERFIEELFRTQNSGDMVALLHRFGAYIETLFGQVNMRTILADYPFER